MAATMPQPGSTTFAVPKAWVPWVPYQTAWPGARYQAWAPTTSQLTIAEDTAVANELQFRLVSSIFAPSLLVPVGLPSTTACVAAWSEIRFYVALADDEVLRSRKCQISKLQHPNP